MRAVVRTPPDLGRLVKRLRESHGLSQRELADRLGTSQRYIYELEAGKPKMADDRYFELLALLGITLTAEAPDA
ncbi:transcriptional regulator with XRE-family HTH domain [Leifsonia sp. AK011]|uniref:helix-turn-helix transcriptional regulator n=1 Tax=Leifsonia sp. AK011 TaxID=2723075 RepID=UPI0015CAB171|nr:helix-turn-helix transcriptional regulator [Leifsonia sp. AK011]NYF09473.1 transcriptional regulator with XRE-family HTH domain [Leifsonia sp. AK011]